VGGRVRGIIDTEKKNGPSNTWKKRREIGGNFPQRKRGPFSRKKNKNIAGKKNNSLGGKAKVEKEVYREKRRVLIQKLTGGSPMKVLTGEGMD